MDGLDGPPNRRSSPQRTPRPRREQGTDHHARRDRTGPGGVRHPGCCRVPWVSVDGVLAQAHGHGLLTVVVVVASNALGGTEWVNYLSLAFLLVTGTSPFPLTYHWDRGPER